MELNYDAAMRLVDRIYARHQRNSFAVDDCEGFVTWDAAQQLCDFGLLVLHAGRVLPRACDLRFRAVPAPNSEAPYRLVPMVDAGARWLTVWSATLTEGAVRQVYRPNIAPSNPRGAPRLLAMATAPTMAAHATLDGGAWAPEQATLVEMLAEVPAPAPTVRRRGFFSPAFIPDDELVAPILRGSDLPVWAVGSSGRLLPATMIVLEFDDGPVLADGRSPAMGLSATPDCLWFNVVEECTLEEAVEAFDLPRGITWRINHDIANPTARFRSSDSDYSWDFVLRLPQGAVIGMPDEPQRR